MKILDFKPLINVSCICRFNTFNLKLTICNSWLNEYQDNTESLSNCDHYCQSGNLCSSRNTSTGPEVRESFFDIILGPEGMRDDIGPKARAMLKRKEGACMLKRKEGALPFVEAYTLPFRDAHRNAKGM